MSNSANTHKIGKPTLASLAAAGMLVYCKCYGCNKTRTYLASDLADYFGPDRIVGELFRQCPQCKFDGNWRERYRYASNMDVLNGTVIRKLKGFTRTARWRDEPYQAPEHYGPPAPKR